MSVVNHIRVEAVRLHTSLKSGVGSLEATLGPGGGQNTLAPAVIPPIFLAPLMLFILKTFLFLWPAAAGTKTQSQAALKVSPLRVDARSEWICSPESHKPNRD